MTFEPGSKLSRVAHHFHRSPFHRQLKCSFSCCEALSSATFEPGSPLSSLPMAPEGTEWIVKEQLMLNPFVAALWPRKPPRFHLPSLIFDFRLSFRPRDECSKAMA
jgi:hypothetical protein